MTEADPDKPAAPAPAAFIMPQHEPDEFAHIPSRPGRPPIVALVAVGLAVFLAVRLWQDVRYAFSSSVPRELGDARALAAAPLQDLPLNRYVRLQGVPERESAVILDTRGSWKFSQFFRLQGTAGRVFVKRAADPLPVSLAERDRFTGRLLPFDKLSFSSSIGRYFGEHVSATHFFRPAELLSALGSREGDLSLPDLAGNVVTVGAGERLYIDVARPGHYRIGMPRDRYPESAKARKQVEALGARVLSVVEGGDRHQLEVQVGDADRDRVLSALGDLDRFVRLRPARDTIEATVAQLRTDGDSVLMVGQPGEKPRSVPLDRVASVRTRAKVEIPADAVLLLEAERPRSSLPSVVVLAFLLAFAAVNLLGLRRPA